MLRLTRMAARGKRASPVVAAFLLDVDAAAIRLAGELERDEWRPGIPRAF
jgi:hypothetical protein